MGREKARLLKIEEDWDRKAAVADFRCSLCSMLIIHCERDVYFRTGMCGYCTHIMAKDD